MKRQELYDLVWTTPMYRLAPRFGLSGQGLAKTCYRHRIPRPGRGDWAKIAQGHRVRRPPLPKVEDARLDSITIRPQPRQAAAVEARAVPTKPAEPRIPVRQRLTNPHPLVRELKKALEGQTPDKYGVVTPRFRTRTLNVAVAPQNISRALRILDALLKELDARGHQVDVGLSGYYEKKQRSRAIVDGSEIEFHLREVVRQEERKRDPKERWGDRWNYIPTARLGLHIDEWEPKGIRKSWTDGKTLRLEDMLHKFVATLDAVAAHNKERRRLAAIEAERREAEAAVRRAREEAIRQEHERRAKLETDAVAWQRANLIREYASAVRGAALANGEEVATVHEWTKWAFAHADRIDPLVKSPPVGSGDDRARDGLEPRVR